MVAKLGHGSSHVLPVQPVGENDILSPSTFMASAGGPSPPFPREYRRKSSASSIIDDMSLDSDSDEESGLALMTLNPRIRSDSVQTSGSSTQSFENKGKDGETEEKEGNARHKPATDLLTADEEKARQIGALAKARSESLGKIARSPSAPEKERPRVDTSSLSRSSSAPQGPTPEQASNLREGIIMMRRAEELEASASSSSSASLNDSSGDPDLPPAPSSSADVPPIVSLSLPVTDHLEPVPQSMDQRPDSSVDSSMERDSLHSSSFTGDNEQELCEPKQELKNTSDGSEEETSLVSESEGTLSEMPESEVSRSMSGLFDSTSKCNESQKQAPHIKSQLIAQHKIQSVITQPEQPRKRISLPRRSSPVMSRKNRPEIKRAHGKSDSDLNGILQRIREAASPTASSAIVDETSRSHSQELSSKTGIVRTASETFPRSPVKANKSHYPLGMDLIESRHRKVKSSGALGSGSSSLGSRKKSMSLSDLLNIGKDLTYNRNKDKDSKNDSNVPKPLAPLSPLSPTTDEDAVSPTDANENRKEEKRLRFRLRRKASRTDIKDGIASGPNMDPKRASRHFFKESLMLESS